MEIGGAPALTRAISLRRAGGPLMVFRSDIHSETPSSNVLMPSVTTMVFTRTLTTRKPCSAPIATVAATATIPASHTFHPWFTTRTGRIVAANPKTAGTDKSTNSPTVNVHISAAAMNTSGGWGVKDVWKGDGVGSNQGWVAA